MWLLGGTGGALMGFLHSVLRFRWTALDDLRIGSAFLRNLLSETERACGGVDREPFTSRLTLFGMYENVVDYPPAFRFDPQVRLVPAANHIARYAHSDAYFELLNEVRP
jgi:hypothetical protein